MGGSFSADSTVTVLLTQLGITGVILFYGILVWAYRRDPRARPVYLVFAITSLTINITEVFPVNFLLGLALAGTLSLSRRARAVTLHDQQVPEQVTLPPSQSAPTGGEAAVLAGIAAATERFDRIVRVPSEFGTNWCRRLKHNPQ